MPSVLLTMCVCVDMCVHVYICVCGMHVYMRVCVCLAPCSKLTPHFSALSQGRRGIRDQHRGLLRPPSSGTAAVEAV